MEIRPHYSILLRPKIEKKMKISELKQPYRRMAEYLGNENNTISHSLNNNFFRFYNKMHKGEHPEITPEIKKHFPPDFDFSGEDVNNTKSITLSEFELINLILDTHTELSKMGATGLINKSQVILNNIDKVANLNKEKKMSLFDKENQRKIEDENLQKAIYTQLAKEGKFDELPDTCEFSEAVELEVWDGVMQKFLKLISGKYRGLYMDLEFQAWDYAQLPTQKIDFSEFKAGDVVEVELTHNETRIGWFDYVNDNHVVINVLKRKGNQVCNGGNCAGSKMLNKEKIKSITKIK